MVITVLVTGIPRFVSLKVLSYNLDSILSPNEVGKFRLREYTNDFSWNREIFVDFNNGFEAMCAQELLHNFELILENGTKHKLKAKVIGSSPSKLPSTSPKRDKTSLMPYGSSSDVKDFNIDDQLKMIEKYQRVVRAETELVVLKRRLRKEKKKYSKDIDSTDSTDSDSSSDATSKRKRKKKSKKRSKSKKRRRASKSPSQSHKATVSSSDNEPSCSFVRQSKSPGEEETRKSPGRIRSRSRRDSSMLLASKPSTSRSHPISPSKPLPKERTISKNYEEKRPKSRHSRSRTRKLKSKSRSPGTSRRRSRSRSKSLEFARNEQRSRRSRSKSLGFGRNEQKSRRSRSISLGFRKKDHKKRRSRSKSLEFGRTDQRRRRSRSRSNSRHKRQKSPYYHERDFNYKRYSNYTEERRYKTITSPQYRQKSEAEVINVNRNKNNRIVEITSDAEDVDIKSPINKSLIKERPVITEEDKALIANKLEEASKSIVNEINIAVSFKHVAQLKVLSLAEKEQALTSIKKCVDDYLKKLIPDTMALPMTVIGIVRNFRMSFSKDEENKLVEGIINDIIRTREQGDNLEVKVEVKTEPIEASDWRAVDDLLRDIENEDNQENSTHNNGVHMIGRLEKKSISPHPIFFLPVKKLLKQMYNIIEPLDFDNDESLEYTFFKELKTQMRNRMKDLLNGKEYVPTMEIIQLYRETYPLETDLMFVNEVYIPIVKGIDGNEDLVKNTELGIDEGIGIDKRIDTDKKIENRGLIDIVKNVNDNKKMHAEDIEKNSWRNVFIKQEANSDETRD